jgi:uncharacterized DUF497 family protein
MDIEFDTAKDETNRLKHGMPLALGAVVLMNMVGRIEDDRCDYEREGSMRLAWSIAACSSAHTRRAATPIG